MSIGIGASEAESCDKRQIHATRDLRSRSRAARQSAIDRPDELMVSGRVGVTDESTQVATSELGHRDVKSSPSWTT
jgi:hypothetical protein